MVSFSARKIFITFAALALRNHRDDSLSLRRFARLDFQFQRSEKKFSSKSLGVMEKFLSNSINWI